MGTPSGAPSTRSISRSGRALSSRKTSGFKRSRKTADGNWWRSQVVFPVPLGPKRKNVEAGFGRNRGIISILSDNMAAASPYYKLVGVPTEDSAAPVSRFDWNVAGEGFSPPKQPSGCPGGPSLLSAGRRCLCHAPGSSDTESGALGKNHRVCHW